jgi:hypothetical protein
VAIHQTFSAGEIAISSLAIRWRLGSCIRWMLDFGLPQFDQDVRVKDIDLEAFDANLS